MRGLSYPSPLMVAPAPGIIGGDNPDNPHFQRLAYDTDKAKQLLADAGYPNGFEVSMDCPNDRYVNDEAICTAVVSMLAKVGVKVNLLAQPKAKYFPKILAPNLDTSFYLLGWTPGSFDSWNVLHNIEGCPRKTDDSAIWAEDDRNSISRGKFNLGGYCNPKVDALADQILVETNVEKRASLIQQAWEITTSEIAHIPLHQQSVAWGVSDGVVVKQRADNQFAWRHVTVQ
jgi:peptide/nickel transport system substrate-binding protein